MRCFIGDTESERDFFEKCWLRNIDVLSAVIGTNMKQRFIETGGCGSDLERKSAVLVNHGIDQACSFTGYAVDFNTHPYGRYGAGNINGM